MEKLSSLSLKVLNLQQNKLDCHILSSSSKLIRDGCNVYWSGYTFSYLDYELKFI